MEDSLANPPVPTFVDDDASDVGDLVDIVGFNLRLAQGTVLRHFSETFADLELTQKQVSVLWLINDRPGISQVGLAARLRMDRATTMAIVNRLQARGFLKRMQSPRDKRMRGLKLTDEGRAMLLTAKDAIKRHEAWLKAHYKPSEIRTLINLLSRLQH